MGLEFFKDGDFPHGGGWHPFVLVFKFNFLEGDYLLFNVIFSLEDYTVGSFTYFFDSLVSFSGGVGHEVN